MSDMREHEVVGFVLTQLQKDFPVPPVPAEAVDARVDTWRASNMYNDLSDQQWSLIAKEVKARVKITMDLGVTLHAANFKDWLPDRHADIDWRRWVAYKQMLTVKGFTPGVLATLDASTDDILNCLGDPTVPGAWKRRGLVIGDVQSGKTATYLGAVNKAADAGFRLIVLLAGGTEALRKQTQFRVDEGLIGRDSSRAQASSGVPLTPVIGVGNWHSTFVSAQGLTTQESDFRKNSKEATNLVLDPDSAAPYVFVLKKNKTALTNLRDWLHNQRIGDNPLQIPMLLVDDESDYASVNTKDDESPTLINAMIRSILAQVSKSSYLAFTATPFANVFIDHETEDEVLGDDLFPSDYIRTLDAPSNYVGARSYFGTEDEIDNSRIVKLDDANCHGHFPLKHKSQHIVDALPSTLLEALRTFVVASAIREARGDSSARSMLVNVSRFKLVQSQVHQLVEAEFERIKAAIELHATNIGGGEEHAELTRLREVFHRRYAECELHWDAVQPRLKSAVHNTPVKLINSDRVRKVDSLAELESDRMIAVGGDVLSRGLTLDGLTVSYFHRMVGASDTLLQMARWFGYRPGYDDLCRVWIPDEVADQFRYVSSIVDELRAQLRAMKRQKLTPKEFGLAVRTHPESFLITARNKMRSAEAKAWTIDIAGRKNLETSKIDSSGERILRNWDAVTKLVKDLESARPQADWNSVPGVGFPAMGGVDKIFIADFLEGYVPFVGDPLFADSTLSTFFARTSSAKLQSWLVGFVTGAGTKAEISDRLIIERTVRRSVKLGTPVTIPKSEEQAIPFRVSGSSARLAGSTDVWRSAGLGGKSVTEPAVYEVLPHPVLLIYVLEPILQDPTESEAGLDPAAERWDKAKADGAEYLVGVKIGIPGTPGEKGAAVKYVLNSVALGAWAGANVEDTSDDDLADVDGFGDE